MNSSSNDFQGHIARLAKEFSQQPRVVVFADGAWLHGELQSLDLSKANGSAAGVLIDELPGGEKGQYVAYAPDQVRLFSEYKDELMNFIENGAVGDGYLISKAARTTLCELGMAVRVPGGWNIVTAAGVEAAVKVGWLRHA